MWEVIGKTLLVTLLLFSILLVGGTGIGFLFGGVESATVHLHILAGLSFIVLLIIHLIHRRKKLLKLKTQMTDVLFYNKYPSPCNLDRLLMTFEQVKVIDLADRLQIPPMKLVEELRQGKIDIVDVHSTLRDVVKSNDEKLFTAITIALRLVFPSKN
ncbi:hypothetical protein RYD26_10835 [Pasteurellaceae bacterium LIM206]|nr:hypothetical protein [Pasteurellaceae bacterium LIM206]